MGYRRGVFLLGLVFYVLGFRLAWIFIFAGDIPYLDQWYYEAGRLYPAWESGTLGWETLLAAHNEHRPLWTGLVNLWVYEASGWDSYGQMLVSALLATAAFLMVCRMLRPTGEAKEGGFAALLVFIAVLFSLPLDWSNLLVGFQTQFYFLLLFGVLHLGWVLRASRIGLQWGLGWGIGMAGLFSMAAGLLAPLAVAVVSGILGGRMGESRGLRVINVVLGVGVAGLGWWILPDLLSVEGQTGEVTLGTVFRAWMQALSWPFYKLPIPGLLVWAPAVVFIWRRILRDRTALDKDVIFSVGMAIWVLGLSAAIAVARPETVANRYFGLLALGVIANANFLRHLLFVSAGGGFPRTKGSLQTAAALWLGLVLPAIGYLGIKHLSHEMPRFRTQQLTSWVVLSDYLDTGAWPAEPLTFPHELPYPDRQELGGWMGAQWFTERGPHSLRPSFRESLKPGPGVKEERVRGSAVNYLLLVDPWPESPGGRWIRWGIFSFPLWFGAGGLLLFRDWRELLFGRGS